MQSTLACEQVPSEGREKLGNGSEWDGTGRGGAGRGGAGEPVYVAPIRPWRLACDSQDGKLDPLNKLTSVFYASALSLMINFITTSGCGTTSRRREVGWWFSGKL